MQQFINELTSVIMTGLQIIGRVLRFIYDWSIGGIFRMFGLNFASLPPWKQFLYILVVAAIAYFFYKVGLSLLQQVVRVLKDILGLVGILIDNIVPVLIAGVVAFGGVWVILNIRIPWLDSMQSPIAGMIK